MPPAVFILHPTRCAARRGARRAGIHAARL